MTKRELCIKVRDRLRPECKISLEQAGKIVECVMEGIMESVAKDGRFYLADFGTFRVKERAARKGRNPRTGELMDIPSKKAVTFKAAPRFMEMIQ